MAARDTGRLGARVAGNRQAQVYRLLRRRDQCNLHRSGTRCDTDSLAQAGVRLAWCLIRLSLKRTLQQLIQALISADRKTFWTTYIEQR